MNDVGWRGTADAWLDAAYEVFLESGVDAVKILPLAKRLNLSRTSFYWFYNDRDSLLNSLVQRWKSQNTGSIVDRASAYADSLAEAMLNVSDCWFDDEIFDSKLEFSMRSWALQSPDVLEEIHSADEVRLEAIRSMFMNFQHDPLAADVSARALYLTQIGYITMQIKEDVSVRMKRMPEYVKLFTSKDPTQRELNRFFSRHGYVIDIGSGEIEMK